MRRKVLVSPDYGAGWSSWQSGDKAQAIAEYEPIIEYVESGAPIESGDSSKYLRRFGEDVPWDEQEAWLHPDFRALVKQMMEDLGLDDFYTGGADGLTVEVVEGPYRIDEYDGAESITTASDLWA